MVVGHCVNARPVLVSIPPLFHARMHAAVNVYFFVESDVIQPAEENLMAGGAPRIEAGHVASIVSCPEYPPVSATNAGVSFVKLPL